MINTWRVKLKYYIAISDKHSYIGNITELRSKLGISSETIRNRISDGRSKKINGEAFFFDELVEEVGDFEW